MLSDITSYAVLEILLEIRNGVDDARQLGVICDYPRTVTIDGVTYDFQAGIQQLQSRTTAEPK